jgi:Domain of unknown function (DUF222)
MESNTDSTQSPAWRTALQTALEELTGQDLDRLGDTALVDQALELRQLLDRFEGIWLKGLATVDGRGAARADQDTPGLSTAGWLRARLHMGAGVAHSVVRTARALYRGPLVATGQALTACDLSPAHAQVLACGTQDLAPATTAEAEPVLLEAARRLDPPSCGGRSVICAGLPIRRPPRPRPNGAMSGGACGSRPAWGAWSPSTGCWNPRPARRSWPRWRRWPARPTPPMSAAPASATPTPSPSWPAATWKPVGCPRPAGCGPSCWSPSTWIPSSATLAGWAATPTRWDPWTRRRVGGWPATAPSPGSWSPATPIPATTPATRTA